ncbi:MAG: hypothetical protein H5T69_18305 [Chloroflexi bacterium]|nr:hypothetical protein [Chloroflexota bacterium]
MGSDDWSFDEDVSFETLLEPGRPRCYHCGTPAPDGVPERSARCAQCKYHLHTCPNCVFYSGLGCLIFSPYMWGESGVMGQDCPYFTWRRKEPLTEPEILEIRKKLHLPGRGQMDENVE